MLGREYLADPLYQRRTLLLTGEITEELCDELSVQLMVLALTAQEEIRIIIDSDGGSIDEGFWLYDLIRSLSVPTIGIVAGRCFSMACTILQACTQRLSLPHSMFFIHSPNSEVLITPTAGGRTTVTEEMQHLTLTARRLERVYLERTKLDRKSFRAVISAGDRFIRDIDAPKALRMGLIDRITTELLPAPLLPR